MAGEHLERAGDAKRNSIFLQPGDKSQAYTVLMDADYYQLLGLGKVFKAKLQQTKWQQCDSVKIFLSSSAEGVTKKLDKKGKVTNCHGNVWTLQQKLTVGNVCRKEIRTNIYNIYRMDYGPLRCRTEEQFPLDVERLRNGGAAYRLRVSPSASPHCLRHSGALRCGHDVTRTHEISRIHL
ncbi:hypothetical protein F2P81_007471 [Scophthalmus maximus]|uniref:Uncharacterized protein n=1 Tax=Scophthalmus maximus TaxID=52904 RepID=A0A6A4SVH3_SCOMX|nr:hypothetical protein F2P81_007471 [Scophthalmus maximus]